jgi:uncharacterized protein (DUF2225 family)
LVFHPFPLPHFQSEITLEEFKEIKSEYEKEKKIMSIIFFEALNNHDGETIMNLAKAAWFFKDCRKNRSNSVDRERALILFLKETTEQQGIILKIGEIAKLIDKTTSKCDGYSALRRKCKALGLKISPSRKIKKK